MIVTKKEAFEKWCPFVREETKGDIYDHANPYGCIANRCMAWRWSTVPDDSRKPATGYCGMAGRPVPTDEVAP